MKKYFVSYCFPGNGRGDCVIEVGDTESFEDTEDFKKLSTDLKQKFNLEKIVITNIIPLPL